jgi:hypothetical protein
MFEQTQTPPFIDELYVQLVEGAVRYFFPSAKFQPVASEAFTSKHKIVPSPTATSWTISGFGFQHSLTREESFSDAEVKLLKSIASVLDSRYRILVDGSPAEHPFEIFRGLPEDRYVSAYLNGASCSEKIWHGADRVHDAIEVLRTTSLSTYENRRISTGALLFGQHPDPCHKPPVTPAAALRYSSELTSIRTFYRLADGLQTLALVDSNGLFVEIVDIDEWAESFRDSELPVPAPKRYQSHSRATLCGGHVCMILTPNGEMKIFADGMQVFHFWDGRWRITDAQRKYDLWTQAIGNQQLAERLFTTALNLAEDRRGGLLVVLDDPRTAQKLVSRIDLLGQSSDDEHAHIASKGQFQYLLHDKRIVDVPSAVLETVARIDGGIVLDKDSNLLAFGAILRHPDMTDLHPETIEGGRTTAAVSASRFGNVLKVSEDGLISFYQNGKCVWDM